MTETVEHMADAELISAVRHGDVAAFGTLYERHVGSARRAAACLVRTPTEREDLVAEAFTRLLRILREGGGPDVDFRPYLLVTMRNAAIHSATRGVDISLYADMPDAYLAEEYADPVIDGWNARAAASAFASLPERWRMVLWHTEVEKESPAAVAPLLGMRPNSVAALAYRAREGLRQAYLRMHVAGPPRVECEPTVNKLAAYVRGSVPRPLSRKISRHLEYCPECRARADTLTRVNDEIAGMIAPVVLGGFAGAYLHAPATTATAVVATSATVAAADSGLATGMLAVKAIALKAGAAVAVAAAAVTTTAAAPAGVADGQATFTPSDREGGSSLSGGERADHTRPASSATAPPPGGKKAAALDSSESAAPETTPAASEAPGTQASPAPAKRLKPAMKTKQRPVPPRMRPAPPPRPSTAPAGQGFAGKPGGPGMAPTPMGAGGGPGRPGFAGPEWAGPPHGGPGFSGNGRHPGGPGFPQSGPGSSRAAPEGAHGFSGTTPSNRPAAPKDEFPAGGKTDRGWFQPHRPA